MNLLVLSDIHGNKCALDAVIDSVKDDGIEAVVLLGDLIDYGMHSNEVIAKLKTLQYPVLCNIYGNHEASIINDEYERFSSERGRKCAKYTKSVLNSETLSYIENMQSEGILQFTVNNKRFIALHGSLKDIFWESVALGDDFTDYKDYDYVLSGHSHIPHYFEFYFKTEDESKRNKKKTIFINPGSVGQPRNHNNMAQFVVLNTDSEEILFKKIAYNIEKEQKAFNGQVDDFYCDRLKKGV